jgi:hypothetical protein
MNVDSRLSPEEIAGRAAEEAGGRQGRPPDGAVALAVGLELLALLRERFLILSRGGVYYGERWPPLAASTLRRGGRRAGVLDVSGRLLLSLSPPPGHPDQVFDVRPGRVRVGTRRPGARHQHRGTYRIPIRRLWPARLPPAWKRRLLLAAGRALAGRIADEVAR